MRDVEQILNGKGAIMAKFSFYLDTRKAVDGGVYPLVLNLAHQSKASRIPLGMRFTKEEWEASLLSMSHEPRNKWTAKTEEAYLAKSQYDVNLARLIKEVDIEELTVNEIRNLLLERVTGFTKSREKEKMDEVKKSLFLPHYRKFMESRVAPGTREIYNRTLKKILEYDENAEKLTFDMIDKDWLMGFDSHLALTMCANSRNIHFRNIRATFNEAIGDKLTTNYPFENYKLPKLEETKKLALALDKIRKLKNYPCEAWQEEYRDMFMLQFYLIGINLVDLLTAKPEDLVDGRFEYRRNKTHKLYSIKVEPEAMAIIEKYRGEKYLLSPMDRYTNHKNYLQHMNRALKKIGLHYTTSQKKTGNAFFPKLSSAWARHTWATVASALDIPVELIGRAMGHSWIKKIVTSIYIDFDMRKVDDANRKVIDAVCGTPAQKKRGRPKKDQA